MREQHECILSGGVYLRHRSGKVSFSTNLPAQLPRQRYYTSPIASVQLAAFGRTGVQETVPLFHST